MVIVLSPLSNSSAAPAPHIYGNSNKHSNNHTNCETAYRMACNMLFYHFMRQPLIMSE